MGLSSSFITMRWRLTTPIPAPLGLCSWLLEATPFLIAILDPSSSPSTILGPSSSSSTSSPSSSPSKLDLDSYSKTFFSSSSSSSSFSSFLAFLYAYSCSTSMLEFVSFVSTPLVTTTSSSRHSPSIPLHSLSTPRVSYVSNNVSMVLLFHMTFGGDQLMFATTPGLCTKLPIGIFLLLGFNILIWLLSGYHMSLATCA